MMESPTADAPKLAAAQFLAALHRPSHILVAISGGSDSTGLLVALSDALPAYPFHRVSAVTIDHGLRVEAADEARSVSAFCARLGISHRTLRWEGAKPATGLMAAAREARYTLLATAAMEAGADLIVTGHTLDDQEETLLMRAARAEGRGEAATGIADAVLFDQRIWIVRPLLGCRRADIRAGLQHRGIGWIDDPSNVDAHYERVRVRATLAEGRTGLAEGGPGLAVSNVASLPVDGGEERQELSGLAARWLGDSVAIYSAVLCRIDRAGLDIDRPVLCYGLSQLGAVFGGQKFGCGRAKMERILSFVAEGLPGRRTAGGVVFDLRRDGLYLMRESRNIDALHLVPGASGVWDGRFQVANRGQRAVQIVAAGPESTLDFPDITPRGVVMRAAASAPQVRLAEESGQGHAVVEIIPYLAPFDRFLTRFDLAFADRLATLFGRTAYLLPPL
jgi:tRNA(Ile)-lysidine synthase